MEKTVGGETERRWWEEEEADGEYDLIFCSVVVIWRVFNIYIHFLVNQVVFTLGDRQSQRFCSE